MKRLLLLTTLLSVLAFSTGWTAACAIPVALGGRSTAQLTAPGVQALHTVEIVKVLDVVRDIAIDGEAAKVIPTPTAVIVVKAHKAILVVIRQSPNGWKAQVLVALDQLKADIPSKDAAQFLPYINAAISTIKAVIQ